MHRACKDSEKQRTVLSRIGPPVTYLAIFCALGVIGYTFIASSQWQSESDRLSGNGSTIKQTTLVDTVEPEEISKPAKQTEPEPAITYSWPLHFDTEIVDFGKVQRGSIAESTVHITNTTKQPIRILKVKTTCGCTEAEVTNEPFDPGESVEVTVRFTPKSANGVKVNKAIRFVLDGDYEPVLLGVTGEAAEFVKLSPKNIDFRVLEMAAITISSTEETLFRVVDIEPPVALGLPDQSTEDSKHHIVVSRKLWILHGSPERITLKLDHPEIDSITFNVRGDRNAATGIGNLQFPSIKIPGAHSKPATLRPGLNVPQSQTTKSKSSIGRIEQ